MTTRKLNGPLGGDYVTDGRGNAVLAFDDPITDDNRLGARLTTAEGALVGQVRGLALPNGSDFRLMRPLVEMGTAPTVTWSATATLSGQTVPYDDDRLTILGGVPYTLTVGGHTYYQNAVNTQSNLTPTTSPGWGQAFWFDGDAVELKVRAGGTSIRYRVVVDGEYADLDFGTFDTSTDQTGDSYIKIAFASAAPRLVELWVGNSSTIFGGLICGATDTVWAVSDTWYTPKISILGDSFTAGALSILARNTWIETFQRLWVRPNILPHALGATGYLNNGGQTFLDTGVNRMARDVVPQNADIVILAMGHNDYSGFTQSQISAAVATCITAARGMDSNPTVIVLSNWCNRGDPVAAQMQCRDGIASAAAEADLFIDMIGGTIPYTGTVGDYADTGWITGTGTASATASDGNADIYRGSDGTHPTQAGHVYLGYRLAEAIAAAMPILGGS